MSIQYKGWFDGIPKTNFRNLNNQIAFQGTPSGNSTILYTSLINEIYGDHKYNRIDPTSKSSLYDFILNLTPEKYAQAVINAIKDPANSYIQHFFIQIPVFALDTVLYFEAYPNPTKNPSTDPYLRDENGNIRIDPATGQPIPNGNYVNLNNGKLDIASKYNLLWTYNIVSILEKSEVSNKITGWYIADEPEISGYKAEPNINTEFFVEFSYLRDRYLLIKELSTKPQVVWLTDPALLDKNYLTQAKSSEKFCDIVGTGITGFYNGESSALPADKKKYSSYGKKTKALYRRLKSIGIDKFIIGIYGESKKSSDNISGSSAFNEPIYDELYFQTLFNYAYKLIPDAIGVFIWSWSESGSEKFDPTPQLHSWRTGGNSFINNLSTNTGLKSFTNIQIQNLTVSGNEYRDEIKTKFVFTDKFITSTSDISGSSLYVDSSLTNHIEQGFYIYNKWTGGVINDKIFATGTPGNTKDRYEVLCYGWDSSLNKPVVKKTFPYGSPIPSECSGIGTSFSCNPINLGRAFGPDLACRLGKTTYYLDTQATEFDNRINTSFSLYTDSACTRLAESDYYSNGTVSRFWDKTKVRSFEFAACPSVILPSSTPTPTPTLTPTPTTTPPPFIPCKTYSLKAITADTRDTTEYGFSYVDCGGTPRQEFLLGYQRIDFCAKYNSIVLDSESVEVINVTELDNCYDNYKSEKEFLSSDSTNNVYEYTVFTKDSRYGDFYNLYSADNDFCTKSNGRQIKVYGDKPEFYKSEIFYSDSSGISRLTGETCFSTGSLVNCLYSDSVMAGRLGDAPYFSTHVCGYFKSTYSPSSRFYISPVSFLARGYRPNATSNPVVSFFLSSENVCEFNWNLNNQGTNNNINGWIDLEVFTNDGIPRVDSPVFIPASNLPIDFNSTDGWVYDSKNKYAVKLSVIDNSNRLDTVNKIWMYRVVDVINCGQIIYPTDTPRIPSFPLPTPTFTTNAQGKKLRTFFLHFDKLK